MCMYSYVYEIALDRFAGVPKGVILTHRNMVANSQGIVDYLRACVY